MLKWLLTGLLSVTVGPIAQAQVYTCKPDLTVGYVFNEQSHSWNSVNFLPKTTFVVRRLTEIEKNDRFSGAKPNDEWAVYLGDDKYGLSFCSDTQPSLGIIPEPMLICRGPYNLYLNRTVQRFQVEYVGGYIQGYDNNNDTPSLSIGRCVVDWPRR